MVDSSAPTPDAGAVPLVAVKALGKRFSGTVALDALDLSIYPGEVSTRTEAGSLPPCSPTPHTTQS